MARRPGTWRRASSRSPRPAIVPPGVARALPAGRLARERQADASTSALRLEINAGHVGGRQPQPRGLRHDDAESDRGAGAGQLRARPRFPRFPWRDFQVLGGLLFADGPVNETKSKFLPRGAAAYALNDKTVVRGGVGLFSYDYFFENINQAGFSQPTRDHHEPRQRHHVHRREPHQSAFRADSSRSRWDRRWACRASSVRTSGRSISRIAQTPYYTRWEFSVQRDLGLGFVAAATYLGSRGSNLPVVQSVNNIPIQYLSTSRTRDNADGDGADARRWRTRSSACSPGSATNTATTVQQMQLLRPYPEFGTFAIEKYVGSDRYNAADPPARQAVPQRQLVHDAVHALVAARQAQLPQPGRRPARRSRVAQRPAEPVLDRRQRAAAVRTRREVGPASGTARRTRWRAAGR